MYRWGHLARISTGIALWVTLTVANVAGASPGTPDGGHCRPVSGVTSTDIGSLGGPDTVPFDLDDRGVVVGVSDTDIPAPTTVSHAFRWRRGVITDMTPTADYGVASDINRRGQILFRENDESGERMFIWTRGETTLLPENAYAINDRGEALLFNAVWRRGTVTDIPAPDPGHWISSAGLGNGGHVFGYVTPFPGPGGGHPPQDGVFVWRDGTITVIRVAPYGVPTPVGVDRTGRLLIVAYGAGGAPHALLSDGAGYVELPSLTGTPGASTTAADINDRGEAVGSSVTALGATHAVLWRNGQVTDLHALGTSSTAAVIGPRGHVAGTYVADDGTNRAFLWWCGRMTDLGPTSFPTGSAPTAVNARGQVLLGRTLYTPTR
jgi:probable HAF family extracellular repeat protein